MVLWATLLGCSSAGKITQVEPCVEIPFIDGPEGACTNNVTHKSYLVNADEWAKQRPKMIMLRGSDWTKIKLDWLKGCRMLVRDGKSCEVALDSIDKAIQTLDQMASKLIKP